MKSGIPEDETLSREYMANERTLLSWIRTGMNAISLGILLDIVVRSLSLLPEDSPIGALMHSGFRQGEVTAFGVGMIVFGAFVEVVAVARFIQYKRSISRGVFTPASLVYLLMALGLLTLGVAYVVYVVVA